MLFCTVAAPLDIYNITDIFVNETISFVDSLSSIHCSLLCTSIARQGSDSIHVNHDFEPHHLPHMTWVVNSAIEANQFNKTGFACGLP